MRGITKDSQGWNVTSSPMRTHEPTKGSSSLAGVLNGRCCKQRAGERQPRLGGTGASRSTLNAKLSAQCSRTKSEDSTEYWILNVLGVQTSGTGAFRLPNPDGFSGGVCHHL